MAVQNICVVVVVVVDVVVVVVAGGGGGGMLDQNLECSEPMKNYIVYQVLNKW